MSIIRNKEVRGLLLSIILISIITISIGFYIGTITGLLVLFTVSCFCVVCIIYTSKRYGHIKKLSSYLRRIRNGEYSFDIRDNEEGELSILKSEIYKVTIMLSEYNDKLRQEKMTLSNQLADISHQLKTPLTSMMVMVDLLRNENLPSDKRKLFTSQIHTQLERIEWLVSSLLKMSKLDAGVVTMKPVDVVVGDLIDGALKPMLIPMELKEVTYHLEGREEIIKCDLQWTTEALLNIIKNCVEHTGQGGSVYIKAINNPLYTEIKLIDNGKGIKKADLPHIFTRFYRGENASPDSVGIGLAMSMSIIKSHFYRNQVLLL